MSFKKNALQKNIWPESGKHILAQYDDETIVVYQAYKPSIGKYAAINQYFGGDFSYSRMSWIKPNFLWMMYRSGWGTKPGQEVTLAIRISRLFFDTVLEKAVASSFKASANICSHQDWKQALDDNFYLAAVLMDLSKAFDCLPHDLLLLKCKHYGLSESSVNFVRSYLSNRKQCVKIGDKCSSFQNIVKGVPKVLSWDPFYSTFLSTIYFLLFIEVHYIITLMTIP